MSLALLYGLVGIALVAMGLYAALAARHVLRRLLGLNVLGSGVFMMLVALASRSADSAERPDPVPHAMVLTGIVVAVSATALALALLRRMHAHDGSPRLPEDRDGASDDPDS
ncbi:MAG: NADH-quinone oxidoreductase subunit K [Hydrogenophaga sp.]|uniref:NADH-quinone oxidoreductase subunit K n=1 Tax=Hydrogenophaga sp. TaxID=1904254 RepID=UPI002722AFF3|nr:NADH-quinone oxidoreductase subunit K [Hydrogenophaga sp.]MDO9149021.1 NADH-quinone oxidoreductase subunit K [Hydrogenophaga sp.]MDO9606755.1 NADH-quinone oxidoreductase subunit K [Hydrogenophaga sp.]MDP2164274.1 NADH-quinone oxidoreductase subunit K [Hydrogenophaga sp.]MDP3477496.1 NADH-quinone oxidoreductase subunit K [Hydrogenophaga sp.]